MEIEHLVKQVDWLDEERRKEKTRLGSIEERVSAAEANIPPLVQEIRELNSELLRLNALISRMDGFDEAMLQIRKESKQRETTESSHGSSVTPRFGIRSQGSVIGAGAAHP